MPPIRVVDHGSLPWWGPDKDSTAERDERGLVEIADPGGRQVARFPHAGGEEELYLHESQLPPESEVAVHAHREDEIIYVVEGEMHLGARVLRAGSSVYFPGMTLYAFRAGPEGLRFLNFRGRRDVSHIKKDELMAERAESRT